MENITYKIKDDTGDPNYGDIKWAEFAHGDGFVQIRAVLDEYNRVDTVATQKKVNDWVEASKPWDELV